MLLCGFWFKYHQNIIVVLGRTIDSRLTFYSYIKQSYKKIGNKLNALKKIAPYLNRN